MERKIYLRDNCEFISYVKDNQIFGLTKKYLTGKKIDKQIKVSINKDCIITFSGMANESGQITFDFNLDDPIYFVLNRIINNKSCKIIDDDISRTPFSCYMTIFKADNVIRVIAVSDKEEKEKTVKIKLSHQFHPNLKNFIDDLNKTLLEEYHQFTIDEYQEMLRIINYIKNNIENQYEKCCSNCCWTISPELEDNIKEEQGYTEDDIDRTQAGDCCVGEHYIIGKECSKYLPNDQIEEEIKEKVDNLVYQRVYK